MFEKSWVKLDKSSRSKDCSFPMDFLQTFICDSDGGGGGNCSPREETPGREDVELSLGLSLNGRFGVEPRRVLANNNYHNNNRLIRAFSVADFLSFPSPTDDPTPLSVYPPLTRTCSLPVETEDEWKKRKELQSLRRSEAKRKRVEKLKNVRVAKAPTREENCDTKRRNLMNGHELCGSSPPSSLLLPLPRPPPPSIGSSGSGGSSGVSDLESQPFSGINKEAELNSTASQQPVSCRIMSLGPYGSNQVDVASGYTHDTLKAMLADMPCVSTKGDGVNGKRVEGFLYRYKKGKDVRIVCVCHGSFLTPAEFVRHAGGGDVEHPLRHIVVNPPSPR